MSAEKESLGTRFVKGLVTLTSHISGWSLLRAYGNASTSLIKETPNALGRALLAMTMYAIVPVFIMLVVVFGSMAGYHAFWPDRSTDPSYLEVKNISLSNGEKGAMLAGAAIRQLEIELNDGWTPNAYLTGGVMFDNYVNCQKGVVYATKRLVDVSTNTITRMGDSDQPDVDMKIASDNGFNQAADDWGLMGVAKTAESFYWRGIEAVHRYQARAIANQATANVLSNDVYTIFMAMTDGVGDKNGVLDEVFSRLTGQANPITFTTSDDELYFAVCAVVPVRDMLNVIRTAYVDKIDPGSLKNLDEAIGLLNMVSKVDPILTIDTGSNLVGLFAGLQPTTTRALSVPVGVAFDRIKDVAKNTVHSK